MFLAASARRNPLTNAGASRPAALANNVGMLGSGCCDWRNSGCNPLDSFGSGGGNGNNINNYKYTGGNGDNDGSPSQSSSPLLLLLPPVLYRALLGGIALTFALAAFPSKSHAMHHSASASPISHGGLLGSSAPSSFACEDLLSSSAPSPAAGLADMLERASLGGGGPFSRRSSNASAASRPRSKVMHVACKGSTLVVPLTGDAAKVSANLLRPGPFQRTKIMDAPIALSVKEAAIAVEGPQYRVRESMRI
ncbi:hypothetical protein GPECTOR_15g478 [Gonium pectorale]|uniref:Uncharacterized protein n=1 Tax=Gonium pectorale TaxID=33097 RepID=A0A150GLZ6_GONPE|nr:hypothetical protein GPECTOR_15g478 [Gonium pectorale]|eukprot:KXZ50792.1 hypothetical protein GPECTOR_15g478 [Gonium pectorale]